MHLPFPEDAFGGDANHCHSHLPNKSSVAETFFPWVPKTEKWKCIKSRIKETADFQICGES